MTMAHKFELTPEAKKMVAELASIMQSEHERHLEEFVSRSESWQDGDKGMSIDAWIEELGNMADALESFEERPDT